MPEIQAAPTDSVEFSDTGNPALGQFQQKLIALLGVPVFVDLGTLAPDAVVDIDFSANRDYQGIMTGDITVNVINSASRAQGKCTLTVFDRTSGSHTYTVQRGTGFSTWLHQWAWTLTEINTWNSYKVSKNADGTVILY